MYTHGLRTFLAYMHGRPIYSHENRFLLYSALNINFKGVHMKLKIVALAISVEKIIFAIFCEVLMLSYKPSNFARAILPYAVG